ncbi:MAG: hypothetical protein J6Y78_09295 [Paludibacteraceae bacterium]|nr:hypothetical protein [Paludibacteraceae bacterium]
MRRRWLKSSATKGVEITYIVDSNFKHEQSDLSDRIFDQTFDDWLLFNDIDYSRNLEYSVEEAVEKDFEEMGPRGLAEYIQYVDEYLDDKVLSIIGKYDRSYNKLHLICTLAPGVDPESIKARLGDYIEGQLSDGWGEGFEQQMMTSTEIYAVYSEDDEWDVEYFTYWRDAEDAVDEKNDDIERQMEEDEGFEYAEYDSVTVNISTYCSFWNRDFRFNKIIISRDKDGFDDSGYDDEGYDREGFNRSGKDRGGFDRTGRKPMRETGPVKFDLNKTGRVTISNPYENLHNSIRRRRH